MCARRLSIFPLDGEDRCSVTSTASIPVEAGGVGVPTAFLIGMLAEMALANMLLYAFARRSVYLLYALQMLAVVGYAVAPDGMRTVCVGAYFAFATTFTEQFLRLAGISKRVRAALYGPAALLLLVGAAAALAPSLAPPLMAFGAPVLMALAAAAVIAAVGISIAGGSVPARYFVAAMAGPAIGFTVAGGLDAGNPAAPLAAEWWVLGGVAWQSVGLVLAIADRLRGAEQQAARLGEYAYRDPLTAIPNRRAFDERLDREWRRALRSGSPLALVMIDIDHFKNYNDKYGHQRGDECLKLVAVEIGETARRAGDFAARYGGEEFAMILADTPIEGAQAMGETVRMAVRDLEIPFGDAVVTISAGCAAFVPADWQSAGDLVAAADAALYIAKATGRDRVVTN